PARAPRLPLRHRPGARGVQAARGAEAALHRRPRPPAGVEPGGGAADLPRRGRHLVRALPRGSRKRARRCGARARSVGRVDEAVLLPRGHRLAVTVGGISADGVYLPLGGGPGSPPAVTIGRITLNLSLLKKTVSR